MSEELLHELNRMQTQIISVSMNLESLIQEHKKYLAQKDSEQDIGFQQSIMLDNLMELQTIWQSIKSQLKIDRELPPINNSFHIYFDNKMKILIKQQIKEIVLKINQHAGKYGIEQIIEPSPRRSSTSPMELEQLDQGDQNN